MASYFDRGDAAALLPLDEVDDLYGSDGEYCACGQPDCDFLFQSDYDLLSQPEPEGDESFPKRKQRLSGSICRAIRRACWVRF